MKDRSKIEKRRLDEQANGKAEIGVSKADIKADCLNASKILEDETIFLRD